MISYIRGNLKQIGENMAIWYNRNEKKPYTTPMQNYATQMRNYATQMTNYTIQMRNNT